MNAGNDKNNNASMKETARGEGNRKGLTRHSNWSFRQC